MNQNNNKPAVNEFVQKGAEAASIVQGAVKTGKAVSGIAKGAASGGPYGAAAAAVWENRKVLSKISIVVLIFFSLPILFVLMLPALIFGGVNASAAETPILNDNPAIYKNIDELNTEVGGVVDGAHDDIRKKIDGEVKKQPEGTKHEINDGYKKQELFNSIVLISQYCVWQDDYEKISKSDLMSKIEPHKDKLFSYKSEQAEKKDDQGNTYTLYTYTVTYAGEDYFAKDVFELSDEKKQEAKDLADNLVLFLKDRENTDNVPDGMSGPVEFSGEYVAPLTGWRKKITSEFSTRADPFHGQKSFHSGMDIASPAGTPIYAFADGKVIKAHYYDNNSYGLHVILDHGKGFHTLYGHCSAVNVKAGQVVKKGDIIGRVGTTGRSTGNHLHFETRENHVRVNPRKYLK